MAKVVNNAAKVNIKNLLAAFNEGNVNANNPFDDTVYSRSKTGNRGTGGNTGDDAGLPVVVSNGGIRVSISGGSIETDSNIQTEPPANTRPPRKFGGAFSPPVSRALGTYYYSHFNNID